MSADQTQPGSESSQPVPVERAAETGLLAAPRSKGPRIVSLDQFRGYTVAGMLLVNFIGGYAAIPAIFKHHNTYCSYADVIMPQFFFAVGFAFRLTLRRRIEQVGAWTANIHVFRRNLGLILLGAVLYHLDGGVATWAELQELGGRGFFTESFQRRVFQALVHIGVTSLWVWPVITAGPGVRIGFMIASAALHALLSYWFYFEWAWNRPVIDGGPLGFLTWSIPMLVGSLTYDAMAASRSRRPVGTLVAWSVVLMAIGYGLACLSAMTSASAGSVTQSGLTAWLVEPPFVPPTLPVDMWTMSQRTGSVSYLTFAAGFSLAVYALFVVLCDLGPMRVGLFRTFGQNALAAYVIHMLVADAVKPFVPRDAPLWYVLLGFGVFFGISYLFVRYLEKNGIHLRM